MLIEMAQFVLRKLQVFFTPVPENNFRARIFAGNFLVYFLFFVLALKAAAAMFVVYFPNNTFFADITRTTLIELANADREKSGLVPLKENPVLDRAAYLKAQDMLKNDYFSHNSPLGVNPWYWFKLAGYNYKFAGENLAIGFVDSGEVNDAWLDSPSHKANILNNKYQEIGIAVLTGDFQGAETTIVVQMFGSKQPVLAAKTVTPTPVAQISTPTANTDTSTPKQAEPSSIETKPAETAPAAPVVTAKKAGTADLPSYDKVLGAASEKQSLSFDLISFASSQYGQSLRIFIYFSIIFIILLLFANFLLHPDFAHKDLLLKTFAFVLLLLILVAADKGVIISLIPHDLAIF